VVDRVLHDQEPDDGRRSRAHAEQRERADALATTDQIAPEPGEAGALLTRQR
jgi:hypothetical protein